MSGPRVTVGSIGGNAFSPAMHDVGGGTPRVSEALSRDHERLAHLEVGAFVARATGDTRAATAWYEAFSSGLKRHISIEEQFLFPVVEERCPDGAAASDDMRTEHRAILGLLAEILRKIGDPAQLPDQARARFHEILEVHHGKEEGTIYPALDALLTAEEAEELVVQIQTFPG